jgi:hypothetical protein
MKVREHRGSLNDSLATTFEVTSREELVDQINSRFLLHVMYSDIGFTHQGMDKRIGWDSYLITVKGYGVFGYADGQL